MSHSTPVPVVSLAIDPKTDADRAKLDRGLQHLMAEDRTFRVRATQSIGRVVIEATGELHLEIIVDRLRREFEVEVLHASVPASEMWGYATDLRARTRGRATHTMHFGRYERVQDSPDLLDDDRGSFVGAPRKPAPKDNEFGVALPEPDDEGTEN